MYTYDDINLSLYKYAERLEEFPEGFNLQEYTGKEDLPEGLIIAVETHEHKFDIDRSNNFYSIEVLTNGYSNPVR